MPKPGRRPSRNPHQGTLGKVIVTSGAIIVLSGASEQDWFEAAIASGGHDPLPIITFESAIPSGLQEALEKKGGKVTMAEPVTIDGKGIPHVPESMWEISETYPGKPTHLPCQPVLNVFPDAAPTEWEGHQVDLVRGGSYPHSTIVCDRLEKASRRYLEADSECASTLRRVDVVWRKPTPPEHAATCWERFRRLLKEAEARGVDVRVR